MNPSSNNIQERIPLNIRNVEPQSPSSAARQRRSSAYRFTDQRLMQHLDLAVSSSETIDALLIHVSRIVNDQSECLALWASQTNEEGHFNTPYLLTDPEGHALWVLVEDQTKEMIDRVSKTKQICSSPIHSDEPAELIVAPVSYASGDNAPIELMIIGCFSSQEQSVLRQQWLVGFVTQTITRWYQHRAIKHQETKNRSLNDTMGLMHALDQTSTISEASLVIANNLRKLCQTEQVAVSFCDNPNRGTLKAISDVEMMDANSESNKIINNACNQAIATGEILCYPPLDGSHAPELLALDKYCKANGVEACIVAPFQKEDGKTIGSVLFAVREDQLKNETFQTYLGRMVSMVSGHLDVVVRANQGLRDVAKQRFAGFRKSKLTKAILFGALALGVLMMVPLPYRVGCECEIQPVMRRFIASPYDGILEKSLTESGKIVKKNEVIAHLDGRQLRMEQSGLRAEYAGAKKRRDSSLAQGDIATSQIARSEMKRHTSKLRSLIIS